MKILYIHGHNGSPDGEKSAMIRRQFPDAEIIAPQHDSQPALVFQLLDGLANGMKPDQDLILGSSLGGFWADFFSLKYQLSAVLINPAVHPSQRLTTLGFTRAAEYAPYENMLGAWPDSPRTVLLAEDDDVIPYHEALNKFAESCTVRVFPSGGHRMNDPESLVQIQYALGEMIQRLATRRAISLVPE
jgi:predicted esterase YcpF (UPF0227 family)